MGTEGRPKTPVPTNYKSLRSLTMQHRGVFFPKGDASLLQEEIERHAGFWVTCDTDDPYNVCVRLFSSSESEVVDSFPMYFSSNRLDISRPSENDVVGYLLEVNVPHPSIQIGRFGASFSQEILSRIPGTGNYESFLRTTVGMQEEEAYQLIASILDLDVPIETIQPIESDTDLNL